MSSPPISNNAPMDHRIGANLGTSGTMISELADFHAKKSVDSLSKLLESVDEVLAAPISLDFGDPWFFCFSVSASAKGGINIIFDTCIIQFPKFLSVRHPLIQMVLYAEMWFNNDLVCCKSMLQKSIVHTIERLVEGSGSFPSPSVYEAGWFSANPKSNSHNTGAISEFKQGVVGRINEPHLPVLFDMYTKKETGTIISQTLPAGHDRFNLSSVADSSANTETKRNGMSFFIFMLSIAGNGDSSSEENVHALTGGNRNGETDPFSDENRMIIHDSAAETSVIGDFSMLSSFLTGDNGGSSSAETAHALAGGSHIGGTDSFSNDNPVVILDSGAQTSVTGNIHMLSYSDFYPLGKVFIAANGNEMVSYFSGSVRCERFELNDVFFLPDVGNRIIVSGIELDRLGYGCYTGKGKCIVSDLRDMTWSWRTWTRTPKVVGEGCLVDGFYMLDYLRAPRNTTLL